MAHDDLPVLSFIAHGLRIGVWSSSAETLAQLRTRLLPTWEHCAPNALDQRYVLRVDDGVGVIEFAGEVLCTTDGAADLLDQFERWLHVNIGAEAKGLTFVHAGAVVCDGRGLVLPGVSHAGKSTLVKALVDAGAVYYSDDFAVIDGDGQLHPYPRRLSLREPQDGRSFFDPRSLGWSETCGPVPVNLVATLVYRSGASLALERVTPGEGSLSLLANTVSAQTQTSQALAFISSVAAHAHFVRGERGDAHAAAVTLLNELDQR